MQQSTRQLAVLAMVLVFLPALPGSALEGEQIPPPGMYWRAPLPDGMGNLNFAVGSAVRLHAAPVEIARVDRVVYLADGVQVGQVTEAPYSFDWPAAGSGTVVLRAEARDGGGTVQGWCERTIRVIGEGLRLAQAEISATLATGSSTTVTLDLSNLGPGDTEWALHVQGGTAPGGTAGAIDKTFQPSSPVGTTFTYRDQGTPDSADDEIWLRDGSASGDYQITRRRVSDWAVLGVFEKTDGDKLQYCEFGADGDRFWNSHLDGSSPSYIQGLSLIDVASKTEIRHIQLDGTSPSSAGSLTAHSQGVVYLADSVNYEIKLRQFRSRDGRLVADKGVLPFWKEAAKWKSYPQMCWKDGHMWVLGSSDTRVYHVKLFRWTPGMDDAVEAVSWTTSSFQYPMNSGVCPAAEPGFLWVYSYSTPSLVMHVDTGHRPWLFPVTSAGTLANGAGQSVTVRIDASTAPVGTYHGVLAFTQYPNADIPQITVPVTLTVTSGGGNQAPTIQSAAWADANPVTLPAGTTVHVVASDPDGDALTYAWSKVSGAGTATFAARTAANSGVTFSTAGAYVLRVTVSDGRGGSVASDVSVTVNPGAGVDPRADVNRDGVVNALDLQIVIANFGQTVP